MGFEPETYYLGPNKHCPNNDMPVLIYRDCLPLPLSEAKTTEFLESHAWEKKGTWGHIAYRHFHPNTHECYGIFQGESRILVGCGTNDTSGGEEIEVHAGDVIVLPAGTGHCCLQSSTDYRYIGVYPEYIDHLDEKSKSFQCEYRMASLLRRLLSTTPPEIANATIRRMNLNSADLPKIFLPPVNRSMQTLDKSFFRKVVPLAAATIPDVRQITAIRRELEKSQDLLRVSPIKPLRDDDSVGQGAKCLLLRPGIDANERKTWSQTISRLVEERLASLRPYDLTLTYDDWTMHNILEAVLPEIPEEEKETPAGFAQVGHVAHVNLREAYLPYKYIIGQILVDKNPNITTVINKTFDVGTESVFRTFPYEVIAGPDDLDVTVHESGCEFKFNFGKVYWNSRLGTEHSRLFEQFKEGEAVCDVMAGVGPFAVPAGKRKVFVRANDLNPDSYQSLEDAIKSNKVSDFVSASCEDGRAFIRTATRDLQHSPREARLPSKLKISRKLTKEEMQARRKEADAAAKVLKEPNAFAHYVMNLPASAIEFLDAFRGLYHGREAEFKPHTSRGLPLIHLYLFQTKFASEEEEIQEICERISQHIGAPVKFDDPELDMQVRFVRLVAPKKKMFCASFRIPASVAFAQP
ncbi:hypothetical protein AYO21_00369 [Fonsecaea monophora]|uniref:tRNA (guanine(37)-N1)-methyltransferase n=1 Tax=Fonsecaea monophora TaxID=254056 RepID=A0A177FN42_9EURO|nr:hypothetical protein AYO21_00369 [Fonsecaea monophora]KAH0832725.1 tRNA (guanine(37)-N1)-methyltransferase [Fonsecaea pedrosoi]OAG45733.1 hypothetical protein AYO21_00369 [Fonsecaea monophora]